MPVQTAAMTALTVITTNISTSVKPRRFCMGNLTVRRGSGKEYSRFARCRPRRPADTARRSKLTAGSGHAVAALPAERGGDALGLRHARHGGNRGVQLRLRQQGGRRRGEPLPCRPFWRQLAPRPGGKAFQDVGQFQVCRLPLPHGPPLPGGGAGHLQARRQDHPQQAAGGNQFQQRHSTSRVLHNNLLIKAINGRNMPTTTNITINPSASTAGGKSNCARAWR